MDGQQPSKLTPLGRLLSLVLVIGLIAFGGYLLSNRFVKGGGGGSGSTPGKSGGDTGGGPAVVDFKAEVPRLAPAAPFTLKDNVVPIEISEYAGYAGIIAANGGLDPTGPPTSKVNLWPNALPLVAKPVDTPRISMQAPFGEEPHER